MQGLCLLFFKFICNRTCTRHRKCYASYIPLYLYAYGCLDGVKMDEVEIKKQLRNEVLILQVKNEMLKMRNELLEMKLQERIKDTDCKVKGLEGQLEVLKQNDKLLVDALLLCEF